MKLPFSELCLEVDRICGTSSTSYPLADKARRANMGMSRFVELALANDTKWSFDDSNEIDLPIATTDIISGQKDYSFSDEFLKIHKLTIKDSAGIEKELLPIDQVESDQPLDTLFATAGQPVFYDKIGSSIILYPAPNFNLDDGIKAYFQRDSTVFVSTDTTKYPGIPSIFHELIALYMAEPYLLEKMSDANSQRKYNNYVAKIEKFEIKVAEYFSKRDKDDRPIISGRAMDCI